MDKCLKKCASIEIILKLSRNWSFSEKLKRKVKEKFKENCLLPYNFENCNNFEC